jgi:putative transposase
MTPRQREEALRLRRQRHCPWHRPPHFQSELPRCFHLSAACYSHAPVIGHSPVRMAQFEVALVDVLREDGGEARAWCVLPNHWHALAKTSDLKRTTTQLGRLHGRTSRQWNLEDDCQGRKCWHACADRRIRSDAHFWATVNYIHHNPVHHDYVTKWRDWPYSSAADYLRDTGEQEARRIWAAYPVLDYGRGWDEREM